MLHELLHIYKKDQISYNNVMQHAETRLFFNNLTFAANSFLGNFMGKRIYMQTDILLLN